MKEKKMFILSFALILCLSFVAIFSKTTTTVKAEEAEDTVVLSGDAI